MQGEASPRSSPALASGGWRAGGRGGLGAGGSTGRVFCTPVSSFPAHGRPVQLPGAGCLSRALPEGSALITHNRLGPRGPERARGRCAQLSCTGPPRSCTGRKEEGKKARPGVGAPGGPPTKPQLGSRGGAGGGWRKGVPRGVPMSDNELFSAVNTGLSSARSQWLCF